MPLFFLLSGFSLTLGYGRREYSSVSWSLSDKSDSKEEDRKSFNGPKFIARRLSKILPVYYVTYLLDGISALLGMHSLVKEHIYQGKREQFVPWQFHVSLLSVPDLGRLVGSGSESRPGSNLELAPHFPQLLPQPTSLDHFYPVLFLPNLSQGLDENPGHENSPGELADWNPVPWPATSWNGCDPDWPLDREPIGRNFWSAGTNRCVLLDHDWLTIHQMASICHGDCGRGALQQDQRGWNTCIPR